MRVMVLVKATEDSESGMLPTAEMLEAMGRYNDELRHVGILRNADGLKPSSHGKRIAFDGSSRTVIDGPFAATRELVAGFWLWEVKDMDEAVAWVKRCPIPCQDRARSKSGRCTRWLICDEAVASLVDTRNQPPGPTAIRVIPGAELRMQQRLLRADAANQRHDVQCRQEDARPGAEHKAPTE